MKIITIAADGAWHAEDNTIGAVQQEFARYTSAPTTKMRRSSKKPTHRQRARAKALCAGLSFWRFFLNADNFVDTIFEGVGENSCKCVTGALSGRWAGRKVGVKESGERRKILKRNNHRKENGKERFDARAQPNSSSVRSGGP